MANRMNSGRDHGDPFSAGAGSSTSGFDSNRQSGATTRTISNLALPHGCSQDIIIMQQALLELVALFETSGKLGAEIPSLGDSGATKPNQTPPTSPNGSQLSTTSRDTHDSGLDRGPGSEPRGQESPGLGSSTGDLHGTTAGNFSAVSPVPRLKNLAAAIHQSEQQFVLQPARGSSGDDEGTPAGRGRPLTLERIVQFHFHHELQSKIATVMSGALHRQMGAFQTQKDVVLIIANRLGNWGLPSSPLLKGATTPTRSESTEGNEAAPGTPNWSIVSQPDTMDPLVFVKKVLAYLTTRTDIGKGVSQSSTLTGAQDPLASNRSGVFASGDFNSSSRLNTARRSSLISAPKRKEASVFLEIERINAIARNKIITPAGLELWRETLADAVKPLPLPRVENLSNVTLVAKPPTSDIVEVVSLVLLSVSDLASSVRSGGASNNSVTSNGTSEPAVLPWTWDSVLKEDPFWLPPRIVGWSKDQDSKACEGCGTHFTFFTRAHHCRNCGNCVCGNCSSRTERLPDIKTEKDEPVRICDVCYKNKAQDFQNRLLDVVKATTSDSVHAIKRAALCSHWHFDAVTKEARLKQGSGRPGGGRPNGGPPVTGGGSASKRASTSVEFRSDRCSRTASDLTRASANLWTGLTSSNASFSREERGEKTRDSGNSRVGGDLELADHTKLIRTITTARAVRTALVLRMHQVIMLPIDLIVELILAVHKRDLDFVIPVIYLTAQLPAVFFLGKLVELGADMDQVSTMVRQLAVLAPHDQLEEVSSWLLMSQYAELLPFLVAVLGENPENYLPRIVEARGNDHFLLGIAQLRALGHWGDEVQRSAIQQAEAMGSASIAKTVLAELTNFDNAIIASQNFQVVSNLFKGTTIYDDLLVVNKSTQDQALIGTAVRLTYGSGRLLEYVVASLRQLEAEAGKEGNGGEAWLESYEVDVTVACVGVALQLIEAYILVQLTPKDLDLIAQWLGASGILLIVEVLQRSDRTSVMSLRFEDKHFKLAKVGTAVWQALVLAQCTRAKTLMFAAVDEVIQEISTPSPSEAGGGELKRTTSLAGQRFKWNDTYLRKSGKQ